MAGDPNKISRYAEFMKKSGHGKARKTAPWQDRLHRIIFEAETPSGKFFDVCLLWAILLSILAVVLESVSDIQDQYGERLLQIEWFFTIIFSLEYLARIICVRRPMRYIFSFFGLVDLLAILPTYLSFFITGGQSLLVIRAVRLLRIFRIFKLGRFVREAKVLMTALNRSMPKITVFLFSVLTLALIMGSIMHLVETDESGFTSIPQSMYWAIVTMTTVGYGDIVPITTLGKGFAILLMIMGYAIIAVPTGIVSVEIAQATRAQFNTINCRDCGKEGHDPDANFCQHCGGKLRDSRML